MFQSFDQQPHRRRPIFGGRQPTRADLERISGPVDDMSIDELPPLNRQEFSAITIIIFMLVFAVVFLWMVMK